MKKALVKIARFVLNFFLGTILVLLLAFWVLRSNWAQGKLLPIVERLVESQVGVPVKIGALDLDLPARAVFREISMRDERGQPMISLSEVRANLLSFSLLKILIEPSAPIRLRINQIDISHPRANIYRSRKDSVLNIAFLLEANDTLPRESRPFDLGLLNVNIRHGTLTYIDSTFSNEQLAIKNRINYGNIALEGLKADFSFHLQANKDMQAQLTDFQAHESRSGMKVDKLTSNFTLMQNESDSSGMFMTFEETVLKTGRTDIELKGQLRNVRPDSVLVGFFPEFQARLLPSVIDFSTLNYLLPKKLPMVDAVRLEGEFWGDLKGIYADSLYFGLYEDTNLELRLALTDYTNADDLGMLFDIRDGALSFDELQRFLPETDIPLKGIAQLKGKVVGDLNHFSSKNLLLSYGKDTDLQVKARLSDYTKGDDLFMDIDFKNSHFSFAEIRKMIPDMALPPWMDRFGRTGIDGRFLGGVDDFVVDAKVNSQYGAVDANVHLMLPPKNSDIKYDGWVKATGLDMKALKAELPVDLENINFTGKIKGHGTTWGTMQADIDGKLTESDINGFHLDTLFTDSVHLDGFNIKGEVVLKDAEGDASFSLEMFLPDTAQHKINLFGDVQKVDLAHYGILPEDSALFSAVINVRLRGDSLENYTGNLRFYLLNMIRQNSEDTLNISRFVLDSDFNAEDEHILKLRSSLLNMDMRGDFAYTKALQLINRLSTEARLYIQNIDTATSNYYANKVLLPEDVFIWDTIRTKADLNDVFSFFQVPMFVSSGSRMIWKLEHGLMDRISLNYVSDSMAIADIGMEGTDFQLNVDKDGSQNDLIASAEVRVDTLSITDNLRFKNVLFRPSGDNTEINYDLQANQPQIGNRYVLQARTTFLPGGSISTTIFPKESLVDLKGQVWRFNPGNSIVRKFSRPPSLPEGAYPDSVIQRFFVNAVSLDNAGQKIGTDGVVSKDFLDILNVGIKDVEIASILDLLEAPVELDGKIDYAFVSAYNLMTEQPTVDWRVNVEDFKYQEKDSIGIRFRGGWPKDDKGEVAQLRLELGHWGKDSIVIKGMYNVVQDSLDLQADSSTILLSWIEPLLAGTVSKMQGSVSLDEFTVSGKISNPRLDGVAHLQDAGLKVDYLNNFFRIGNNTLTFDNGKVKIPGITIQDDAQGTATLKGEVTFQSEFGTLLDLHVKDIRNLKVMDSRKGQNPDFYGKVILEGDSARVTGPITLPFIEAWVSTADDSWLDIPLSSYTSASRLDFVNFVQEGDTAAADSTVDLNGIKLRLTVNARNNARVRLIFDEKVGDLIEARGEGAITVDISEDGDFNMFGAYVVSEGNYLFTAENIVNKKFLVEPGGQIVWNGDPVDAQVNIDAIYRVNADISELTANAGSGQRVPVEIVMHLSGSLLRPEISLELRLDQLNAQDVMGLASYFRGIQYDQQELNKQVVSLLLFRRFTRSSGSGNGIAGVGVTSSISELISNQVNYWISQTFEDANVGLQISTNEFQDVDLALSASLFKNRVTVERNGALIGNNSSNFSIGDLSVQIKLLPKATDSVQAYDPYSAQLVMEIFNREDATIQTANNVSRGLGIFYKKDFDRLSELLRGKEEE